METTLGFCFFFLFAFLLSTSPALSTKCRANDKKALLQIKKDLKNPDLFVTWDPSTDCCDWFCIRCDPKTHHVTELKLYYDGFHGIHTPVQIPPSVGDLPYLEILLFRDLANVTGPIQPTISKLTNLKDLTISWTGVSGPIPNFLAQLKNLENLELSSNKLSGNIPPSLSHPNLKSLDLSRNQLTGPIPDSFGNLKSVTYLHLAQNKLSGPIPASLGNLNQLYALYLFQNKLQGDASFLFGANKALQIADLSRNLLSFDIGKLKFPQTLVWLDLNHNNIYGNLPVGLTALQLQNLNVSYNVLCGSIPLGGELQRLDAFCYFHNKCLCGSPLPKCK